MLKTEIKTAIDHHSHSVGGTRHQFRLQWAALEPRWASRAARYLLAIEVLSDAHAGSSTMHVVTRAGTNRADLLRLVDDALEEHLESGRWSSATGVGSHGDSHRTPQEAGR
jgi:hypothetical protein